MSRKNSRANLLMSARNSRCNSVEPLDILEEESEFRPFINRQEVLAEDEFEDDDTRSEDTILSPYHNNRKTSVNSTAAPSQCPSRTWSRRSSPNRGELLRADDEMVTVSRGGMTMTIPRHLAHHIPPVLIGHLDDEGRTVCDGMCKQGYSPDEIVEFFKTFVSTRQKIEMWLKKTFEGIKASEKERMNCMKNLMADASSMSQKDFLDLVKSQFGEKAMDAIEELMRRGLTQEEAMEEYLKGADKRERNEHKSKLQDIMNSSDLTSEEKIKALMEEMSPEEAARLQQLLNSGLSAEEAMKKFMKEAEKKEKEEQKRRLKSIINNPNLSHEEKLKAMMEEMSLEEQLKLKKLLKTGLSPEEAMKQYMKQLEKEQKAEQKKKLNNILNDPNLTTEQKLQAMMEELSAEDQAKLQKLLSSGLSAEEAMKKLLRDAEKQDKEDHRERLMDILNDPNLSAEEKLQAMMSELSKEEQAKLKKLLKKGLTPEEAMRQMLKDMEAEEKKQQKNLLKNILDNPDMTSEEKIQALMEELTEDDQKRLQDLLNSGLSPEEAMKKIMKDMEKRESEQHLSKLKDIMNDSSLTAEEKLKAMMSEMSKEEKAKLEKLLKSGMTAEQAMEEYMKEIERKEKQELRNKLQEIMDNPTLTDEQKIKAMMDEMSLDDQAKIREMLKKGMTMDEIIRHFTGGGLFDDNNNCAEGGEIARRFQELCEGKCLSDEEMIELMKSQLGPESRMLMEEMLKSGASLQDVLKYFMKHGLTAEEEEARLHNKIKNVLESGKLSTDEAYRFLQDNLSDEARATMAELLKQGYTKEEIIELFKKHGNNLAEVDRELAGQTIDFGADDPNAHLYRDRDVFTLIDREEVDRELPFMSPKTQKCSFKQFITRVKSLVDGRGLTHREILDLMEYRMGGDFLADMRRMRKKGSTLPEIVEFFLKKDMEQRQNNLRIARLKSQAKIDAMIALKRREIKENWGIQISYTFSEMFGLNLILVGVDEKGPAWGCGARPGDSIVTVNDWLISVMDRPYVAMHLLQAGANQVKLGIHKSSAVPRETDVIGYL